MPNLSPLAVSAAVADAIALHRERPGALLPILHEIQDRVGYVPETALPPIADALNLSRADVHGVVTFYHWFRRHPPGRHVLHVCRAEACQSMGGRAIEARIKEQLGIDYHDTSRDGAVTLEPVYCLGHCARAPAVLVDGEPHAGLDAQSTDALLRSLRTT